MKRWEDTRTMVVSSLGLMVVLNGGVVWLSPETFQCVMGYWLYLPMGGSLALLGAWVGPPAWREDTGRGYSFLEGAWLGLCVSFPMSWTYLVGEAVVEGGSIWGPWAGPGDFSSGTVEPAWTLWGAQPWGMGILLLETLVGILVGAAFLILLERKVMGGIQRRKGPNVVGFWGLLQPIADAVKLLAKEIVLPKNVQVPLFLWAPLLTLVLAFANWTFVLPDSFLGFPGLTLHGQLSCGVLFVFAVSSVGVYAILLAGMASTNAYAYLGSLRTVAQMVSYEVFIGLSLLPVILQHQTMDFSVLVAQQAVVWNVFLFFPCCGLFFVALLAETNRAPFDLPEAEGELVAGFNVEYSSIFFTLFFLGEYVNILFGSVLLVLLFLGGSSSFGLLESALGSFGWGYSLATGVWGGLKVACVCFAFVWVRATLPRFKYDQLLVTAWKNLLPLLLGFVFWYASVQVLWTAFLV